MTLADEILAILKTEPFGVTDGALSLRLSRNPVYINQVCRRLAGSGLIVRDEAVRPLVNCLIGTVVSPSPPVPIAVSPRVDVRAAAERYLGDRSAESRYSSFDYCFNYFRSFYERGALRDLATEANLEQSSLQLAFYLASWGMFRGKADLLQRSTRYFARLIDVIIAQPLELWDLDVGSYDADAIELVLASGRSLERGFLGPASDTLVTKLMLGVYGCVPAFDRYFKAGLGVTTFGPKALRRIRAFYDANVEEIEQHRVSTLEFASGQPSRWRYTAAKVIDMVLFVEGIQRGRARPAELDLAHADCKQYVVAETRINGSVQT